MTQFESAYDEFLNRGAAVVVIAAQKLNGLFKGKKQIQQRKYRFPVLFDENREVTRAFGVHHAIGIDAFNIARPAIFVINAEGKICWIAVSPSQTERPRLEDILTAIEACGKY
jgi:methyl-accepting chemotaxis protein